MTVKSSVTIESQPSSAPQELSDNPEWVIFNDDLIVSAGSLAQIAIYFGAGGGADGQQFTIGGQQFTTDSSTPYSSTSFDYSGTAEQSAQNFADMMKSSYRFMDWNISVENYLSGKRVFITNSEIGLQSGSNWINDASTLTPSVGESYNDGSDKIIKPDQLWYQFYSGEKKLSHVKNTSFDPTGRARISAKDISKKVLTIAYLELSQSVPFNDEGATMPLNIRFGVVSKDNCLDTHGAVYRSDDIQIVNSITQHEVSEGFLPQTTSKGLASWMTSQDNNMSLCKNSYAFASIYLAKTAVFLSGRYKLVIRYFDDSGTQIYLKEYAWNHPDPSVWRIPIGPLNNIHNTAIFSSSYYTVAVNVLLNGSYVGYSKELKINLKNCGCNAAEVYFLEDKGGWRTLIFEKIESRNVSIIQQEFAEKLGTTNIEIFKSGGLNNQAVESKTVFILSTEKITNTNRKLYEEFLRSKYHYILVAYDGEYLARKVIIDRGNYSLFERGGIKRLVIPFKFTSNHVLR